MGTILDTPSGQYKTTIVDRVEGMEPTLIIGLTVLMIGMKGYPEWYAGAVKAGKRMTDTVVEYINGIEVIKTFNQSAGSYKKYVDAVSYNGDYYIDWMKDNQKMMCLYQAITPSTLLTVLPVGFCFWASGNLAVTDFLTIIILSLGIIGPVMAAFTFTDDIAVLSTNLAEIDGILSARELIRPEHEAVLRGNEIHMEHVSFAYEKDREQALKDVTLNIPPGSMTALAGPSGSGKSTIAKLIAGFWDVTEGSIRVGGADIRQMPLSQLNSQIAYVSQDTYLFDRSIRENIRMGNLKATDKEVEEAAKKAGCDGFIKKLDHGYETFAGTGGGHLSGGERQRITIARAMFKDAPVIILDEAYANVDPENEADLQCAVETLTHNKTIIMIAHRLKTVHHADQILVLDQGHIVQRGKHEELLKQPGIYAEFVNVRKQSIGWKIHK